MWLYLWWNVINYTLVQDNTQRSGASKSFNQHNCNSTCNNYCHGSRRGRRASISALFIYSSHYLHVTSCFTSVSCWLFTWLFWVLFLTWQQCVLVGPSVSTLRFMFPHLTTSVSSKCIRRPNNETQVVLSQWAVILQKKNNPFAQLINGSLESANVVVKAASWLSLN